jgi:hypothetical protein
MGQLIARAYEQCRAEQKKVLHNISSSQLSSTRSSSSSSSMSCIAPHHLSFSSTTDGYTGRDHESYFGFTVHYFSPDWRLCRMLLKIKLCEDRHTGENVCQWLEETFDEAELDVGDSFSLFFFSQPFIAFPCVLHCVALSGLIVLL